MKNKIQIVGLFLAVLGVCLAGNVQAYSFTGDELSHLNDQKNIINKASNEGLWSYYNQFVSRYNILKADDKLGSTAKELRDYAYSVFDKRKTAAKSDGKEKKSDFLDMYEENITLDAEFPEEKCTGWYNKIDNISFANDFPTALVIAAWYRESTCAYYLPSNGDGPFQIVSKDYGTGDITEEIFVQTIQDFIDFSKKKIDWYNDKNPDYSPINLTYNNYSYDDLWKYAGLYNGLSGATVYGEIGPAAPKYFLEGYEDFEDSKRFGLFPAFLKVLNWEKENN